MKARLLAFASGALFGGGLLLSGMTRPSKVIGFLDVLGAWDPSLLLVMVGAIAAHATTRRLVRKPLHDASFHVPERAAIDRRLLLGAAVFGVGWGLAGFCPGPALVTAAGGGTAAMAFVAAMALALRYMP